MKAEHARVARSPRRAATIPTIAFRGDLNSRQRQGCRGQRPVHAGLGSGRSGRRPPSRSVVVRPTDYMSWRQRARGQCALLSRRRGQRPTSSPPPARRVASRSVAKLTLRQRAGNPFHGSRSTTNALFTATDATCPMPARSRWDQGGQRVTAFRPDHQSSRVTQIRTSGPPTVNNRDGR